MSLQDRLTHYLVQTHLGGDGDGLEADTPLFDLNIIDSSSLFDLVQFLGDETGVDVPLDEVVPENFQSISAMVALAERVGGRAV